MEVFERNTSMPCGIASRPHVQILYTCMRTSFTPAYFNINTGTIGKGYRSRTQKGLTAADLTPHRIKKRDEARRAKRLELLTRIREQRKARAEYLADIAITHRVPRTKCGMWMLLNWTPFVKGRLFWQPIYSMKLYPDNLY